MRRQLRDGQWKRIDGLLTGKVGDPGRSGTDNRLFVEAMLWIARTGSPWRDLPLEFGSWNSTYQRFARWSRAGVWHRVFATLGRERSFREVLMSTWSTCPRGWGIVGVRPRQRSSGVAALPARGVGRGPCAKAAGWRSRRVALCHEGADRTDAATRIAGCRRAAPLRVGRCWLRVDTAFRQALSDMGLPYAVGVTSAVSVWPPGVEPLPPKPYSGMGRPPVMPRRTARRQPMSVKALALSLPAQAFHTISWREGTNEPLSGRFAALRVRHAGGNAGRARLRPLEWLLIE